MKNYFETTMRVDASKTDLRFDLSIAGILELLEDVQTRHTDEMKVDAPNMRANDNAFWVITRNYIHIDRMPHWEETVVVGTYPLKPSAIRSERQNYIDDLQGNNLISCKTEWCALDLTTRKLRPVSTITSYPKELVHKTEKRYLSFPATPNVALTCDDFVYSRPMRVTDLDFNMHVNNVRYANYIVDCYPSDFWLSHDVTDIRIDYISECREGELLHMYAKISENTLRFEGKTDDRTIFTAIIIFKQKEK